MTDLLTRPWSLELHSDDYTFSPDDCLLAQSLLEQNKVQLKLTSAYSKLMNITVTNQKDRELILYPYPKGGTSKNPSCNQFPIRLPTGHLPVNEKEEIAAGVLKRMNETLARVQELESALDQPTKIWDTLREAWQKAEDETDPRMAEIVKQSREMKPILRQLENRIRKVLRRHRELVPIDKVQEMDRASINWLVRQPGRSNIERAGTSQRILAIVRHENFNTLENQVLHSYVILAAQTAREWMLEHKSAEGNPKFRLVSDYMKRCRSYSKYLDELEIGKASPQITPNYVLIHNPLYNTVFESWKRLLQHEKVLDDLWAWQAETWTDFVVLAITLAIDELDESEIVTQSPILWNSEAIRGRWFKQESSFMVFWLKKTNRIIEILTRPEKSTDLQCLLRAHIAIRVSELSTSEKRKIVVWTPHTMNRMDLEVATKDATDILLKAQRVQSVYDNIKNGLIIVPGHDKSEVKNNEVGGVSVEGIALDASGKSLAVGTRAICDYVQGKITE